MRQPKLIMFAIIFLSMLSACSSSEQVRSVAITPGMSFSLTAEEEQYAIEAARQGDADAAYRLHNYYLMGKADSGESRPMAIMWLEESAKLGNVKAQYNLGKLYTFDPNMKDINKARYWLGKAAAAGDKNAQSELLKLKSEK